MSTTSASAVNPDTAGQGIRRILVWDAPVRVFHWLMVLSFAGAYLTAESERWRVVHVTLGYTMAGLVVFRLLWGLFGSRHARFANFVRGPRQVKAYLRGLLCGAPEHYAGHNPAGALAIIALLGLGLVVTASGWLTYNDMVGHWVEDIHEAAANFMLGIVGVHVAGVLIASWLHRENQVGAMVTGRKPGRPDDGIRRAWRSVAVLMLLTVLTFWWLQWNGVQPGAGFSFSERSAVPARGGDHDND
ncbi:cytochrome b/b6 domain-containing protein (plasmid) [Cupriavidus sp. KK10]|uniref:cytochrome b/b6 domain-containing protein n=1 Tax=Cupriavidus sp. KK10 TaxID=1478019 RepID=UPI001BAE1809|nr:cytochrome b/b6 domain-containing protein [Cupriavidus sp. KK10]QUN31909.1 cytochrome b/b6 domain-containing protein [Cupriavidus sp. KK10]